MNNQTGCLELGGRGRDQAWQCWRDLKGGECFRSLHALIRKETTNETCTMSGDTGTVQAGLKAECAAW